MINLFKTRYAAKQIADDHNISCYVIRSFRRDKRILRYKIYKPITDSPLREVYERFESAQRLGAFKSRYYASKWAKAYGVNDYCIVSYRIPGDGNVTLTRFTIYVPAFHGIPTDIYCRLLKEQRRHD